MIIQVLVRGRQGGQSQTEVEEAVLQAMKMEEGGHEPSMWLL